MLANNEIGTIAEIASIGEITRQNGIILHTDAAQAAGHIPIDVEAMNIDLLSMSAHKMYGPKGVGPCTSGESSRPSGWSPSSGAAARSAISDPAR